MLVEFLLMLLEYYLLLLTGILWSLIKGKCQVLHLWMNNLIYQERLEMTTWNVALQKIPWGPGNKLTVIQHCACVAKKANN